jgi:hypothetical protein
MIAGKRFVLWGIFRTGLQLRPANTRLGKQEQHRIDGPGGAPHAARPVACLCLRPDLGSVSDEAVDRRRLGGGRCDSKFCGLARLRVCGAVTAALVGLANPWCPGRSRDRAFHPRETSQLVLQRVRVRTFLQGPGGEPHAARPLHVNGMSTRGRGRVQPGCFHPHQNLAWLRLGATGRNRAQPFPPTCHAEGRGFESLHPLRISPAKRGFLLPPSATEELPNPR